MNECKLLTHTLQGRAISLTKTTSTHANANRSRSFPGPRRVGVGLRLAHMHTHTRREHISRLSPARLFLLHIFLDLDDESARTRYTNEVRTRRKNEGGRERTKGEPGWGRGRGGRERARTDGTHKDVIQRCPSKVGGSLPSCDELPLQIRCVAILLCRCIYMSDRARRRWEA